jgi:GNAT superfamily N-acetyltransferase
VPEIVVERLRPGLEDAFLALHCDANDAGWCRCVAWWVPTWEGWGERTVEENLALRITLFERGEHDGLLALAAGEPVGWCQLGRRDRLVKLVAQLELTPDSSVWAVSCFLVAPAWRGRGVARALLDAAVKDARAAGASRLEGYPRTAADLDAADAWTGVVPLFEGAGFERVGEAGPRTVVSLVLDR